MSHLNIVSSAKAKPDPVAIALNSALEAIVAERDAICREHLVQMKAFEEKIKALNARVLETLHALSVHRAGGAS